MLSKIALTLSVVATMVTLNSCTSARTSTTADAATTEPVTCGRVFAGHYEFGFERAAFVPHNSSEAWWVTAAQPDAFTPVNQFITEHAEHFHEGKFVDGRLFIRVKAKRSERGQYGHRNAYPYKLKVYEVLEVDWSRTN